MIVHLMHHPISAKRFVEPLVNSLINAGIEAELWVEHREALSHFVAAISCPKSPASFDLSINPLRNLTRLFRLLRRMYTKRPTAVCAHQTRGALLPLAASKMAGVRTRIYHNHGTPYIGYSGTLRLLLWLVDRLNCMLASHVTTVSFPLRERMIASHLVSETKCHVIGKGSACGIDLTEYNGLGPQNADYERFREDLGIPSNEYVVTYVGRPVRRKGFSMLLDAWKGSQLNTPGNRLLLIGCTPADVGRVLGKLPSTVTAVGFVVNISLYYAVSDVVVLPSEHEGFPYAILEAAAAGKPSVASNIPGVSDFIKNEINGLLFDAQDVGALTRALIRLKSDGELRRRLGIAGRQVVDEFYDRDVFLKDYVSFIEKVVFT